MMTTLDFLDYLESVNEVNGMKFYDGFCDESKEKSITVYLRSNVTAKDYRGFTDPSTQLLPITVMMTYGEDNSEAQETAMNFWHDLKYTYHTFNGYKFHIVPKLNMLPVSLSKNEAGYFQYAMDFNIFYETL